MRQKIGKIGDWVECIGKGEISHIIGNRYKIIEIRKNGFVVEDKFGKRSFGWFERWRPCIESRIKKLLNKIDQCD